MAILDIVCNGQVLRSIPLSGNPGTILYEDNMATVWARVMRFCRHESPTIRQHGSYMLVTRYEVTMPAEGSKPAYSMVRTARSSEFYV